MNQELELVMNTLIGEMGKMETRINGRMDERFDAMEQRMDRIELRMGRTEKRMNRMEKDTKMYVNMLVDEMGKLEGRMDERFKKVDIRLDSMQHEINGCKLACETVSLLIQKVDQHEYRIQRLEKKMA